MPLTETFPLLVALSLLQLAILTIVSFNLQTAVARKASHCIAYFLQPTRHVIDRIDDKVGMPLHTLNKQV